ncbi:hypothetical protein PIB30_116781 [Stylosanthes scabra]|uniref:Small auxin up regulated protein n=1 Tax=Stylosanthes scabra TaxID=79078 RepID=A0ABU6YDM5_9FABA|nr:hypothetical protein [Stylosanthes scabra]
MLGKKVVSLKKLAKKVKVVGVGAEKEASSYNECLLKGCEEEEESSSSNTTRTTTPTGYFAIYVGEERQRYVVPTSYLNHPLFKILLEKSYNEFGFSQSNGLILPCRVSTFQEVVNAIECNNGKFDLGKNFEDFL